MTLALGVDLGGTKTEAVVVRLGGAVPEILARERVATERERGYDHIVEHTRALIARVAATAGIAADATPPIGVGMPGSVTNRGLVKNSNTTCLNGRSFREDLATAVGRPIAFANDANCFALAEATWGAARDARVAFGVILGTGVGGGVVVRDTNGGRRAWEGANGIAGEWGHTGLDRTSGPRCYCGKLGCVETFLGGPAIEAAYAARAGVSLSLAAIAAGAAAADAIAKELIAERVELFGRALATVINVLDPDVVVLGGGVSNVAAFHDDGARAAVLRAVFSDELVTRLAKNELGDSAGVLGAALLPEAAT